MLPLSLDTAAGTSEYSVRARRIVNACGRIAVSVAIVLGSWLIVYVAFRSTKVIPSPLAVADALRSGWRLDLSNAGVTLREALIGYLWGNGLAIIAGICFVRWRIAERVGMPIAVGSYCVPLVAIAPILIIVLPGDGPKDALAAITVFFTTLVSVMVGLRSSDTAIADLAHALGSSPWQVIRYVKVPAALPSLMGGLGIAAPAAMLGAVLGEYLGASSGLGVALLQAQSSFEVAKTFSIAIVMAALAGVVFALVRLLARVLVPWDAPQLAASVGGAPTVATGGRRAARHASTVGWLLVSAAVVVLSWAASLRLFHLSSYFAKGPLTVLEYLTWGDGAGAHRSVLISAFRTTVGDAVPGYLAGTVVAAVIAVLVVNVDVVGRTFMPIAIALRSIPLVALVPVIILIFGGNLLGVTVLVGLVVFFPTLVNVVVGLRSAPSAGIDLIKGLGGSHLDFVLRVQLRYALPAFFASSRIAIPAALGGATLAEWLATGRGLGNLLVISSTDSQYTQLWAGAIGLVVIAVACYELIGFLERLCLRNLTSVSAS